MLTVNVHQVKTNLSYYLNLVQKGKKVVIAKRNIPIAQITSLDKAVSQRVIGQCQDLFAVPDSFFELLPKDTLDAFSHPK